jgi:hypothetical protein
MRPLIPLVLLGLAACPNPNHTDAVADLGDEAAGVREGPEHRPGQPCLTCHGGSGPGPDFVIGGTVYATRNGTQALSDVSVVLTDADKTVKTLTSNRAGNFYLPSEQWTPTYPISVSLRMTGVTKNMNSLIGRNGGCAFCHYGADNQANHMPPVFMSDQ